MTHPSHDPADKSDPLVEEADLEQYAARNEKPPRAKRYIIKVDGIRYTVTVPEMTGREILTLAGKTPPDAYNLHERHRGAGVTRIALDERVDFTKPGVEAFVTIPRTSPDGEEHPRRDFHLPADDEAFLVVAGLAAESSTDASTRMLVLRNMALPPGFTVPAADVGIIIPQGYPEAPLDMAYFRPALQRADGRPIPATSTLQLATETWQQWSRHRPPGEPPWRPGVDDLSTHLAFVTQWLAAEPTRST